MLLRLVMAVLAFTGVLFLVRKLRGHPLQRVPALWTFVARRDDAVREALEIRKAMANMVIHGRGSAAEFLLTDVDRLIESIVEMARLEVDDPNSNSKRPESIQRALGWLRDAKANLEKIADMEDKLALESMRAELVEFTANAEHNLAGLKRVTDQYAEPVDEAIPEVPTDKIAE